MSRLWVQRVSAPSETGGITVKFKIDEVLDRTNANFESELLRCVNLLQENAGKVEVHGLSATDADLLRNASEDFGWEILPDGKRNEVVQEITERVARRRKVPQRILADRLSVVESLNPIRIYHGDKAFFGYFAAEFASGIVVFENLEADHAMYVVRGNWRDLGKFTRSQLRANLADGERIIHSGKWQQKLRALVQPGT